MTETAATPATRELLRISEAAAIAGVSRVHIWRLVRNGTIPAYQIGEDSGPIRIDKQAFLDWLFGDPAELDEELP